MRRKAPKKFVEAGAPYRFKKKAGPGRPRNLFNELRDRMEKEYGARIGKCELRALLADMLMMSRDELIAEFLAPEKLGRMPILFVSYARAIFADFKNGVTDTAGQIIEGYLGKPVQHVDAKVEADGLLHMERLPVRERIAALKLAMSNNQEDSTLQKQ
jgi:hypothetical protein